MNKGRPHTHPTFCSWAIAQLYSYGPMSREKLVNIRLLILAAWCCAIASDGYVQALIAITLSRMSKCYQMAQVGINDHDGAKSWVKMNGVIEWSTKLIYCEKVTCPEKAKQPCRSFYYVYKYNKCSFCLNRTIPYFLLHHKTMLKTRELLVAGTGCIL